MKTRNGLSVVKLLKAFRGRKVNLHLEEGGVIVNIRITVVRSKGRESVLGYKTPFGMAEIGLEEVREVEPLNPTLFPALAAS
jgi:hypothetical protein